MNKYTDCYSNMLTLQLYNDACTTILRFVEEFSELLMMLETASEKSEILRFLTFRLDFNSYHSNRLKREVSR
jgi:hypothetical protein